MSAIPAGPVQTISRLYKVIDAATYLHIQCEQRWHTAGRTHKLVED